MTPGLAFSPSASALPLSFQFKTQTCRTVNQTHNVLFAADAVENILRECFIFHALSLLPLPADNRRLSSKNKKTREPRRWASRSGFACIMQ
jgi:hypothetical protein